MIINIKINFGSKLDYITRIINNNIGIFIVEAAEISKRKLAVFACRHSLTGNHQPTCISGQ